MGISSLEGSHVLDREPVSEDVGDAMGSGARSKLGKVVGMWLRIESVRGEVWTR